MSTCVNGSILCTDVVNVRTCTGYYVCMYGLLRTNYTVDPLALCVRHFDVAEHRDVMRCYMQCNPFASLRRPFASPVANIRIIRTYMHRYKVR